MNHNSGQTSRRACRKISFNVPATYVANHTVWALSGRTTAIVMNSVDSVSFLTAVPCLNSADRVLAVFSALTWVGGEGGREASVSLRSRTFSSHYVSSKTPRQFQVMNEPRHASSRQRLSSLKTTDEMSSSHRIDIKSMIFRFSLLVRGTLMT